MILILIITKLDQRILRVVKNLRFDVYKDFIYQNQLCFQHHQNNLLIGELTLT